MTIIQIDKSKAVDMKRNWQGIYVEERESLLRKSSRNYLTGVVFGFAMSLGSSIPREEDEYNYSLTEEERARMMGDEYEAEKDLRNFLGSSIDRQLSYKSAIGCYKQICPRVCRNYEPMKENMGGLEFI
jgi:hypothetical protein